MGDFLTKNPFLRLVVALSVGIVAFVCIGFRWWILVSVVVISVALFAIYITTKNRHRIDIIFGLSAVLSIAALGYWLGYDFDSRIPRFAENKKQGFFEVELTRYPIEKQNSVLLYTDLLQYSDSTSCEKIKGKAILYLQKDSNSLSLKSGDKLIIYTTLSLPEKTGNPDEFDFGRHLLRNGICLCRQMEAYIRRRWFFADAACSTMSLEITRHLTENEYRRQRICHNIRSYSRIHRYNIARVTRQLFGNGSITYSICQRTARGYYLRDARFYARLPRQMETHTENQMDSRDIVPLVLCFRNRTLALGISVGIYVFALCCG